MENFSPDLLEKVVALTKRRGFIFPGSEIYGGLAGAWDYGPLGVLLKNNLKQLWWRRFVDEREEMYGLDAAILMNARVWEVSGHVGGFTDPLTEAGKTQPFNLMFETRVGAASNSRAVSYLRPETAQGMFVNFQNVVNSFHPKLPFGLAQIGKAFRNEIAPREFLFRAREFEQMEIEYFIKPPVGEEWQNEFENWRLAIKAWLKEIGLNSARLVEKEVAPEELAHYSKRTIDFEYDFPFGKRELLGLAYRTDFDLRAHGLSYLDEETKEKVVPHVIEPSFGVDRTILAILCEAYHEDEMSGERRVVMRFTPSLAPIKVAVFPLLKNKPELVARAREIFTSLKAKNHELKAIFDDNGNIGKRYRRQDEIGTPWCLTIDFQTLEDNSLTLRERDSGEQRRVAVEDLPAVLASATA